jgi:hypothetical protein
LENRPSKAAFVLAAGVAVAEIKQDGGGLADQNISVLQERRRKRRMGDVVPRQKSHEGRLAAAVVS